MNVAVLGSSGRYHDKTSILTTNMSARPVVKSSTMTAEMQDAAIEVSGAGRA